MLTISIEELPKFIDLAWRSKNNILVIGDPGVGKSQVIESMRAVDCQVLSMTGSSTIEEYVNGIPRVNDAGVLQYVSQQWVEDIKQFHEAHPDAMQVLFLDEFNTADPQVLKTFLTILSERRIPTLNWKLPDTVVIVAAMNPQDQNEGEPLIRPMASRFMTLRVESTIENYEKYLKGEDVSASGVFYTLLEKPVELDQRVKLTLTRQIPEKDWGEFDEKNGHEINPRSVSNFFRALEWVETPADVCKKIAKAFLGIELVFPKINAETVDTSGATYLTEEQMINLTIDELKDYFMAIDKPGVLGAEATKSRQLAKKILRQKGISVKAVRS